MKRILAIFMAAMISNLPHLVLAEGISDVEMKMIPTSQFVDDLDRETMRKNVEKILSREDVRKELAKAGLNQEEIQNRMATLSDQEMKELYSQMDKAQYAGDGIVGILMIVVLVLLIIYLAKRI